jgi:hypothetical protein
MKTYAGIGARELDIPLTLEFIKIGRRLAQEHFILRSGGAEGADTAFEDGCDDGSGQKEIFLPWKGFNHNGSTYILPDPIPPEIIKIARGIYPRWDKVSEPVRRLHARNVMQILGWDLHSPSLFVVCYTEQPYNDPNAVGGTMFGIVLATDNSIPVYNFFVRGDRERFYTEVLQSEPDPFTRMLIKPR